MLDVRRLQLLCDLARWGTIAAVAEVRRFTPSAVSQQLSALEREAGVPLLARTGRSVALTAAGQVLVRHGLAVLAELERADAALAAVAGGVSGQLRVGAFASAVRALLPAALIALGRAHPGLELLVSEVDPVGVPGALRERRIDVGLLNDYDVVPAPRDPGLEDVPLLDEAIFLAVPEGIEPVLAGLRDFPWILATPGTLCHTVTVRLCRAAGFGPRGRHWADDFATVLALVGAGLGASIVPAMAVAGVPRGVRLVELPTRRRTRIACRRGAAQHPAVAAVVAALRGSVNSEVGGVACRG